MPQFFGLNEDALRTICLGDLADLLNDNYKQTFKDLNAFYPANVTQPSNHD
jgi:hypothetical protein